MKVYFALLAVLGTLISGLASSVSVDEPVDKIWLIPQIDGTVRWMTQGQAIKQAILTEPHAVHNSRKFEEVRFYSYSPLNPTVGLQIIKGNLVSLSESNFNASNPTRFFAHGWNGGYLGVESIKIREALLLNGENTQFNFIAIDWSVYAETLNYVSAQMSCSTAGQIVAEFIDWLNSVANLSFDTLTLYGHSLGAHVVGFAGKNVEGGTINTIIGLDTAMPLFDYYDPDSRLSDTDALYVESIHTNGGFKGFYLPIGKAAFYPNGGKTQPGCGLDLYKACAHARAVDYFAEAVQLNANNKFNTVRCGEFIDVAAGTCNLNSNGVRMGDPNNFGTANGIYFLTTNSNSTFGKGD